MTVREGGPVTVHGLLLAAGAGSRMGTPKALVSDDDGPWLPRGVATLREGGCAAVTVVLGAAAEEARALLTGPDGSAGQHDVTVVVAHDWTEGMSASLRAGLGVLAGTDADVALVHLVDLPDVGPDVVRRVVASGAALARASYDGVPGHPVLLGRDHWESIAAGVAGDQGARDYLRAHDALLVECGDLATGADVDRRG
ncbi:nucleotidyltransferase family protein [Nocardioides panacihumi]|uniref:Nucleotidyltransferase family protein n=1 Tax=Nocardioides panacihumi TaxID=400774 RepID=A0ABN2Q6L9_9ACTN